MRKAARLVVAGLPHHVIQRGVRSINIFEDDADRKAYLGFLAGAAEARGLQFLAWCLMTHQVHLLVKSAELRKLAGSWRRVLRHGEQQAQRQRLEAQLESGLPVGTERWVRGLEKKYHRRLRPGRPGRPRKEAAGAPNNR